MGQGKRIVYIDIAKGMAIILVVMGHILQYDLAGYSRDLAFNFIYSFHMPIFMALSGFVVGINPGYPKRGIKSTLFRRFKQLAIPFLIWGIIVMPILSGWINWDSYSKKAINLLLDPDTGAWFLLSLLGIHSAYLFAMWVTTHIGCNRIFKEGIQTIVFLSLPLVWKILCNYLNWDGGVFYLPLQYAIMFYIGSILKRNERICLNQYLFSCCLIMFCMAVRYYDFNTSPSWYRLIISIPALIIFINISYYIVQLVNNRKLNIYYWLLTFGQNSIMIYLVHFLIVVFTVKALDVSLIPTIPLLVILIFVAFLIACICVTIGRIISKNIFLGKILFGKY